MKRRTAVTGNYLSLCCAFSHTARSSPVSVKAGALHDRGSKVDLLEADQGVDRDHFGNDQSRGAERRKILDPLKDILFLCILVVLLLTFIFRLR
jgi:hypothetical protein